jgi:hypothetical protein
VIALYSEVHQYNAQDSDILHSEAKVDFHFSEGTVTYTALLPILRTPVPSYSSTFLSIGKVGSWTLQLSGTCCSSPYFSVAAVLCRGKLTHKRRTYVHGIGLFIDTPLFHLIFKSKSIF